MRPALILGVLALSACRMERSWQTLHTLPPGSSTEIWVTTSLADADPTRPNLVADSCSVALVDHGPDLDVTITDYDSWQGACWAQVTLEMVSTATERQTALFRFHFNLCDDDGCVDFCDSELCSTDSSTQDRSIAVQLP